MANVYPSLVTSAGVPLVLGKELGRGGEGAVYDVSSAPDLVAKVYHHEPDSAKQSKLIYMASHSDAKLLNYTAWPIETLHRQRGGHVVGLLMNKVAGREPIRLVYSPAHRRLDHPRMAWDFLVHTARNTAAAFEVLHSHGHVLGDVNHGNVLVDANSQVLLIDCDSFQVDAEGTLHLCGVGVAHCTPPELQGSTNFSTTARTANHDNFGLALLIFHLLFGGRHPFAGVPQQKDAALALEDDIKAFRYAYARDAQARGFSAPPRSIPVSILPDSMEAMFHTAFTEAGARDSRPTATQWLTSLDLLRHQLTTCSSSAVHRYPRHLIRCPWCELEGQGVVYFVDPNVVQRTSTGTFVLATVWAAIEAIPRPAPLQFPNISELVRAATPAPPPPGTPGKGIFWGWRVFSFLFFIVASIAWPQGWIAMALLALLIYWFAVKHLKSKTEPRLLARQQQRRAALEAYEESKARMQRTVGPDAFTTLKSALLSDKQQLERLDNEETEGLKGLKDSLRERLLTAYLERFFVDSATIEGLDRAKRASLAAYGIETAADIEYHAVHRIRGFGDSLTDALCAWRKQCERDFRFDPAKAVPISEVNKVRLPFAARRPPLQVRLISGVETLKLCSPPYSSSVENQFADILDSARKLAQAEANLSHWS